MSLQRSLKPVLPFILVLFVWTGCSDDQLFHGNARIQTTFRLKSSTAWDGSITIREAYLKLNSLGVTGTLGDQNVPPATYPVAPEEPPYQLTASDSAQVILTLPSQVYDLLDLHLLLFQSKYALVSLHQPAEPTPQPVTDNNGSTGGDGGGSGGGSSADGDDDGATDGGDQGTGGETPVPSGDNGTQPGGETDSDGDINGGSSGDDGANPTEKDDQADDGEEDDNKDDDDEKDDKGKKDKDSKDNDKKDDDDKDDDDGDGKGNDDDEDEKENDDDKDDDDDEDDKEDGDDKEDDDKDDGRARGEVDGTVDLDDFFQNAKPSLVVFATWNANGEDINIVFAVTDVERITIRATQNGDHRVVLSDHGTASVTFDPEQWFQSISSTDLQNASRQIYQGQPVVFIHHNHNAALFDALYSKLVESTRFDFSLPSVE